MTTTSVEKSVKFIEHWYALRKEVIPLGWDSFGKFAASHFGLMPKSLINNVRIRIDPSAPSAYWNKAARIIGVSPLFFSEKFYREDVGLGDEIPENDLVKIASVVLNGTFIHEVGHALFTSNDYGDTNLMDRTPNGASLLEFAKKTMTPMLLGFIFNSFEDTYIETRLASTKPTVYTDFMHLANEILFAEEHVEKVIADFVEEPNLVNASRIAVSFKVPAYRLRLLKVLNEEARNALMTFVKLAKKGNMTDDTKYQLILEYLQSFILVSEEEDEEEMEYEISSGGEPSSSEDSDDGFESSGGKGSEHEESSDEDSPEDEDDESDDDESEGEPEDESSSISEDEDEGLSEDELDTEDAFEEDDSESDGEFEILESEEEDDDLADTKTSDTHFSDEIVEATEEERGFEELSAIAASTSEFEEEIEELERERALDEGGRIDACGRLIRKPHVVDITEARIHIPFGRDKEKRLNGEHSDFVRYLKALRTKNSVPGVAVKRGSSIVNTRLSRIATDGKIFGYNETVEMQKRVELVILIDLSGSTATLDHLYLKEIQEAKNIFLDCREAGIACEVLGHTSDEGCVVYKIASFDMTRTTSDVEKRFELTTYADLAQNYDGQAIEVARNSFTTRPGRKVLLVLSDGKPYAPDYSGTSAIRHTKNEIKKTRDSGVLVFSVSLIKNVVNHNDDIYGKEWNIDATQNLGAQMEKIVSQIVR